MNTSRFASDLAALDQMIIDLANEYDPEIYGMTLREFEAFMSAGDLIGIRPTYERHYSTLMQQLDRMYALA